MSFDMAVLPVKKDAQSLKSQCRNAPWQDTARPSIITEQIKTDTAFTSKGSVWNDMAAGLHGKGQSSRLNLSIDSLHWFRYFPASPPVPKLENLTDVFNPVTLKPSWLKGYQRGPVILAEARELD
ncbi:hypothetical protein HER10_EVM0007410 [Colletotrichum scovillei]|uniref:uncharacterized protein n=1 Tax=Colletotrichum scovillei TaxID=1209932 RepID=UPI0015C3948E|nr:uncharacterized protein HER10_EVM0007410 [Colletotrichum scovillei]KAF4779872.1 hypothetical protein HER10_EVM0007410 [Colletotrichum scovillei]